MVVADLDTPAAAVFEIVGYDVGEVVEIEVELRHPEPFEPFDVMPEHGFAGDGDHNLGKVAGQFGKSRSHSCG